MIKGENMSGSRLKNIYKLLLRRCDNPDHKYYERYGGRGIDICEDWKQSYKNFETWAMSHGYKENLTLDRIDNSGGYNSENCKWSTKKEQANNRSTNRLITYNGTTKTLKTWSEEYGILPETIYRRLNNGWNIDRALTTKPLQSKNDKLIEYDGKKKTLWEWSKDVDIEYRTLKRRIKDLHWPFEKALKTPIK